MLKAQAAPFVSGFASRAERCRSPNEKLRVVAATV
jgi:hypothetical protein